MTTLITLQKLQHPVHICQVTKKSKLNTKVTLFTAEDKRYVQS